MTSSLFVTGGTGFIGLRFLAALDASKFDSIRLLLRDETVFGDLPPSIRDAENVEAVAGDLESPDSYSEVLNADTIVVHLAALTGAARAEEYEAVNVRAVAKLLAACAARKVSRFLHVSTIAVLYPDLSDYPYGRSKKDAEALVRESGLDYTIVRPTVPVDPLSDGFQGLVKLASAAPLLLQPGSCQAQLRPIDVEDVVAALVGLVETGRFRRECFDLGGPESLTVLEFMRRIRHRVHGRRGPALRLPLSPLLVALRALENAWPGTPPVTAGQFTVFRFDGVGESDHAISELGLKPRSIDAMLERSAGVSVETASGAATGVVLSREKMARNRAIERECFAFSRYLLGSAPDSFLVQKYSEAAKQEDLNKPPDRFESLLIGLAMLHPLLTRAIDIYARWLHPRAILRRKLILILAIAETWAPSYAEIDRGDEDPVPVFFAKMAIQGAISVALGLVAALVLHPIKLLLSRSNTQGSVRS